MRRKVGFFWLGPANRTGNGEIPVVFRTCVCVCEVKVLKGYGDGIGPFQSELRVTKQTEKEEVVTRNL